jgi:hypothetical protein
MMELGFKTARDKMRVLNEPPHHDSFGLENAALVAPGDPGRSLIYHRMRKLGEGRMPPLASSVVDRDAAKLVSDWIMQLKKE